MSGQPLATLKIKSELDFGPLALSLASPRLMSIVAQAIARWSLTQAHLGSAFAELIGTRSPSTVSIYATFDSFAVQRKMLSTVTAELLPKRCSDMCHALLAIIDRAAKERHRFAHWVLGVLLEGNLKNEYLLLADPKDLWKLRVRQIKHFRRNPQDLMVHATQPRLDRRDIMAYRETDLLRVRQRLEVAEWAAYAIECLVRATPRQRLEIQRQLLAQLEVRMEYDKLRPRKTKRPKAAPKPPRVSNRVRREAALARRQADGV
jgi:hypothetical protein